MKLADLTSLGRPIDPGYPTNRAIAVIFALVFMGASVLRLIQAWPLGAAASFGLTAGVGVFLAWALARELDPDHDLSAFVAVVFELLALGSGSLGGGSLFWLLLAVRTLNRSTGLPSKILDSLLLLALGWSHPFLTAGVFALDALLAAPLRRQWIFAGLALGAGLWQGPSSIHWETGELVLGAAFLLLVLTSRPVAARADNTKDTLNFTRVRAGQITGLLGGVAGGGLLPMAPLWAAVAGVLLFRLVRRSGL